MKHHTHAALAALAAKTARTSHRQSALKAAALAALLALSSCAAPPDAPVREGGGVNVGGNSSFTQLVPASEVEQSAGQQYVQMMQEANGKKALAPPNHPQVVRLRAIAARIIPHALVWNPRAKDWKWEVNLVASSEVNAFCMPGGKIAFYSGILDKLKLSDDEVAMVMGHEVAHALREHARERMGKSAATNIGASLISQVLGLGDAGRTVANYGAQILTLKFSREDETDADLVGMELAARAGYDPRSGTSLWQKMSAGGGAPPEFMSTHPSGGTRIADIERNLPQVMPLYERARHK
jgi:predicted Zn-dependent protease